MRAPHHPRKKILQKHIEFPCVHHLSQCVYLRRLHWRKWISLCEQLSIGSSFWVRDGVCVHFLWSGISSDVDLCRPCACSQSVWARWTSVLLSSRPGFYAVFHPLWLLQSFHLLLQRAPWAEGRDLMETFLFRTENSEVSHSLTLSSCGSLYLFPSTARGNF